MDKRIYLAVAMLAASTMALADKLQFDAVLTGAEEVPTPVVTDTTGKAKFRVSEDHTALEFILEIEDGVRILAGPGGHIHCAPFGINGPIVAFIAAGLPVGFNGEVKLKGTLNEGNIVNKACGETIAALVDSFIRGNAYVNIHSAVNPSGEIRGQIYLVGADDDGDDERDDGDNGSDDDDDDD